MKVFYKKQKTNIVTYRNYKHFSNEAVMFDVKNSIIQMISENNDLEFDRFNPLGANPTKSSNTLKQFVCKLPTNCLSLLDHFVGLALKGLKQSLMKLFKDVLS